MKYLLLLVLACLCTFVSVASADSIYTWNFSSNPNASLQATSSTFFSGALSVTAVGTTNLFYKLGAGIDGASETGLGLACCDDDHEIGSGQSIALNLFNLFALHVTGINIVLSSIQSGETGEVCDALGLCATISSSEDANAVSILRIYRDMQAHHSDLLTLKAGRGDILLSQLWSKTNAVPEPRTLLMMGTGLVLIAIGVRRKARA